MEFAKTEREKGERERGEERERAIPHTRLLPVVD